MLIAYLCFLLLLFVHALNAHSYINQSLEYRLATFLKHVLFYVQLKSPL